MKFPIRTIPLGLKPRDFFVYSLNKKIEGYHTRPNIPTLVGQLKDVDISSTGFVRYSMIRLVPIFENELFDDYGMPKRPLPSRHKQGGDAIARPGEHILVCNHLPLKWYGVDFGPLRSTTMVNATFDDVAGIAMGKWMPYRPENPLGRQYPWGCAFQRETDAVAFQAHLTDNHQKPPFPG